MTPAAREELTALLVRARQEASQIRDLPASLLPSDAAEAYAIQAEVARRLGWPPLGWKVAATNDEMRRRLRMAEPIFGRSFARFARHSPARFAHAGLLDPIIEAEFVFVMAKDLPPRMAPYTEDEVAEAVAALHAGVEVAECRFPKGALPPANAILADGSGNGHYVLGPEITDWRGPGIAAMPVRVLVEGAVRRSGSGAEVMGHPLRVLAWLANRLPAAGTWLRAGEWVSTGTATGMLPARPGDRVRASFGETLAVDLTFDR